MKPKFLRHIRAFLFELREELKQVQFKIIGCQSKNHPHTECKGELWQCERCRKIICWAEGGVGDELCDDCWCAAHPEIVNADKTTRYYPVWGPEFERPQKSNLKIDLPRLELVDMVVKVRGSGNRSEPLIFMALLVLL